MNNKICNIYNKVIQSLAVIVLLLAYPGVGHAYSILFQNDTFETVESSGVLIDSDNTGGDLTLQFGATLGKYIKWSTGNTRFEINGNVDMGNNQISTFRVENVASMPGGAGGLTASDKGRIVELTAIDSTAPGCTGPSCSPGTFDWNGTIWKPLQGSITTSNATKIITIGPVGRDYTTIAAGAAYLNTLSGGEMWVDPGVFPVTTTVNLSNIKIRGADLEDLTVLSLTGGGKLKVYSSKFETVSISIDAGITAAMGLDLVYNASYRNSIEFSQVNFTINGSKIGIDSTESTKPIAVLTFNQCAESGTGFLLNTVASSQLAATSSITVINLLSANPLKINNWPVTIVGGSNVVTTGVITTIPDRTILVSSGMKINEAITSLGANGGVIKLLVGTHDITSSININNSNIQLIGEGPGTVLRAQTGSWTGGTTNNDAAINVGLTNGTAPKSNIIINNFVLQVGPNIHGIQINGGSENKVMDMVITSIGAKSSTRVGLLFTDGASTGGTHFTSSRNIINNDIGTNRWVDGVHYDGDAALPGQLYGYGNGITDSIISETIVSEAQETCFAFSNLSASAIFSNRARNIGFNANALGLFLNATEDVMVINNTVEGNNNASTIGISLYADVNNSVIVGNAIRGGPSNMNIGINVRDSTSNKNEISENQITAANTDIYDMGTDTNDSVTITLPNGTSNNVYIGDSKMVRITGPTSNFVVTGFKGGTHITNPGGVNNKMIIIYNTTALRMTINNNDAGSQTENRILTLAGNIQTTGTGAFILTYDTSVARWILVSSQL